MKYLCHTVGSMLFILGLAVFVFLGLGVGLYLACFPIWSVSCTLFSLGFFVLLFALVIGAILALGSLISSERPGA